MSIKLLDQSTINKIAAGEVIENPSNVVKELVENSIDAGASSIKVELFDGGTKLIRVIDDGIGFAKDDIKLAFLKHATSKLSDIEDLYTIDSFGFRGEALSSIASVSKVCLITKERDSKENFGIKYEIDFGIEKDFENVAANAGTTFEVADLFSNVPVRKKFLKGSSKENALVEDIITKFALSNPHIAFTLAIDGKEKFSTNGDNKLNNVIYNIYGKEIYDNLLEVNECVNKIAVKGYIARPQVARNLRNDEIYFVNKRFVKNNTINKAIEAAYEDFLMQHKFPLVVLMIEVEKGTVDVNVHPKKAEVRFSNDENIYYSIYQILRNKLESCNLIHTETLDYDDSLVVDKEDVIRDNEIDKKSIKNTTVDELPSLRDLFKKDNIVRVRNINKEFEYKVPKIDVSVEKPFISKTLSEDHKYIGQVFNTYILVEYDEKLYIIDQHAAHEKINFEKILKSYKEGKVESQKVFPSIILKLTAMQNAVVTKNIDEFRKVGYEIEIFGDNDIKVDAVPYNIFNIGNKNLLMDMIDSFTDDSNKEVYDSIAEKIASMSCKAAIKGGHMLNELEVKELLRELFKLDNPYNCPHGRPTIISLSKSEFEKKFGRIV